MIVKVNPEVEPKRDRLSDEDYKRWVAAKKKVSAALCALATAQAQANEIQEGFVFDYGLRDADKVEGDGSISRGKDTPDESA